MVGKIVRVIAGFYDIKYNSETFRVRGSGNLRRSEKSPMVGDIVSFNPNGFVTDIHKRKNSLVRPKVANVDQAVIVMSLVEPNYSSILLNKFLAIVEFNNIKPIIIFTKVDISIESHAIEYIKDGYEVFEINNKNPQTLLPLYDIFKNKLTVFTGQTGVGKSTTISNLSGENRKTQEISKSLGRGKHTTRVVEIVDWAGGELIDTPGFSSLSLNMTKLQLSKSYHDFRRYSEMCEFKDCLHNQEKKCNVKIMLNNKKISINRYNDYLRLLEEIDEQ